MTARRYHFDHWGKCLGYVEDDCRYCDRRGQCLGRVVDGRDLYDIRGVYRGHFDIQGQYWDEHGTYRGYLRGPIPVSDSPGESASSVRNGPPA